MVFQWPIYIFCRKKSHQVPSPIISHTDITLFLAQLRLKNMNLVSLVQSICVNINCDIEVILYDLLFVFASTKGFHPAEDLFNS